MAAGDADRRDHLGAQLIGELAQLPGLKRAQVVGHVDPVEKRGVGLCHRGAVHICRTT